MNRNTFLTIGAMLFAAMVLWSCKKDDNNASLIATPVIDRVNRAAAQAGEVLTVYGKQLVQGELLTEVFINGRPSELLRKTPDSITILVPEKTKPGRLTVTISNGQDSRTAEGPALDIKPTPLIKGFWPQYASTGETIYLITENFSTQESDNAIFIGTQQLTITGRKGTDTLLVKLPDNAVSGVLNWQTYGGPMYSMETAYRVRQTSYPVNTVADWIREDPAFSYMDTLVRGYPSMAGGNFDVYSMIYNAALLYMAHPDSTYTIFLAGDLAYEAAGISKQQFLANIRSKPYEYNITLLAAIVPGRSLGISDLHPGEIYKTPYTMKMHWYPLGTEDANYFTIQETNGEKYAQIYGMYNESRLPVKILREHTVGNATIIELAGIPSYVTF